LFFNIEKIIPIKKYFNNLNEGFINALKKFTGSIKLIMEIILHNSIKKCDQFSIKKSYFKKKKMIAILVYFIHVSIAYCEYNEDGTIKIVNYISKF
jgi:hypothetical protein